MLYKIKDRNGVFTFEGRSHLGDYDIGSIGSVLLSDYAGDIKNM